jgi:hypothetical protein
MDPGAPQTSKRAAKRPSGTSTKAAAATSKAATKSDGVTKSPGTSSARGSAKPNGATSVRTGPVDPRTEDPSAPTPRSGKTLWRRPGILSPRATRTHDVTIDAPLDFAVAVPLAGADVAAAPAAPEAPAEAAITIAPATVVPSAPPVELSPGPPTALAPTEPVVTPVPLPETVLTPILYDQAATIDDVTQIGPILEGRPLHRPIQFRRAPRPRVRRVTRVVRHVDTWSVFKVALVFSVFFYAVSLIAGVLLWQVAYATGTIDNVEKFFEGFGWETFKFNGGQIFHNAWIAGLFVAMGLTGLAVLMATLFNLITDLVGGIRLSVLEEEVRPREERGTEPLPPEPEVVVDPVVIDDAAPDGESSDPTSPAMPVESS